jgi:hypothetical protein
LTPLIFTAPAGKFPLPIPFSIDRGFFWIFSDYFLLRNFISGQATLLA